MLAVCALAAPASAQQAPEGAAEAAKAERKTTNDDKRFKLVGFGQLFSSLAVESTEAQDFNEFRLGRAELGLGFLRGGDIGFFVNTEAIRSAGARSLFGVDNDSLVFRVKHAFGVWEPEVGPGRLQVRVGMIQDVWVEAIERDYDLRGVQPIMAEQGLFFDTSDIGGSVSYSALDDLIEVRAALTNGEGRNRREQNPGKNGTFVAIVRPVTFEVAGERAVIALKGMYRDGSVGPSSAANRRLGGGVSFTHPRGFVGAEFTQANGYNGVGNQQARGLGAWANGNLGVKWLGGFIRFSSIDQNLSLDDDAWTTINTGLYADVIDAGDAPRDVLGFPRLRLYVAWRRDTFGQNAAPLPGVPEAATTDAILITLSARSNVAADATSAVASED